MAAGRTRATTRALPRLDPAPARLSANQALGQHLASKRGWTGQQWDCLRTIWDRESQWNETADNPTSSAYGIAQALPGSKMASAGPDWRTNPATQIRWGLSYIRTRYGTPCAAWAHWTARVPVRGRDAGNWY